MAGKSSTAEAEAAVKLKSLAGGEGEGERGEDRKEREVRIAMDEGSKEGERVKRESREGGAE